MFNLRGSEDRVGFIRENWVDIVAFIPIDFFRAFRFLRFIRVIKVLALFRKYLKKIFSFMVDTHVDEALGILLFAIASGSLLFYITEAGVNRSPSEAPLIHCGTASQPYSQVKLL